ncbi:hypothetical protein X777_10658 [Ooceraea biroi]|uniref:Uncharacterized protein n=1 Tax=Ooceraea biroi TaxID=2015173 RepID=A0A026W310_OOCBI|nr:hypothetical protein X777_10658 [Ooceraea biroi]
MPVACDPLQPGADLFDVARGGIKKAACATNSCAISKSTASSVNKIAAAADTRSKKPAAHAMIFHAKSTINQIARRRSCTLVLIRNE